MRVRRVDHARPGVDQHPPSRRAYRKRVNAGAAGRSDRSVKVDAHDRRRLAYGRAIDRVGANDEGMSRGHRRTARQPAYHLQQAHTEDNQQQSLEITPSSHWFSHLSRLSTDCTSELFALQVGPPPLFARASAYGNIIKRERASVERRT